MPTWTQSLAVGVPVIDKQHKELFARADALLAAMKQGQTSAEVKPLLDFLDDYCSRHFATEETLMREQKYPGLHEHIAQHAQFVKQFQDIVAQFDAKGPSTTVSLALQRLICGWLVQHVSAVDKKLAGFLSDKRVSVAS